MANSFDQLKTAREVAREAGIPLHRVDYAIQRLNLIEARRLGIVRLFDPTQVERIRQALTVISTRRLALEGGEL